MKDQFLKLAGVKNEKEFYKKFPTEESFMAKYGKQIKKLQGGADLISKLAGSNTFAAGVESVGDVISGFQQMKNEKNKMLEAEQMEAVSKVGLQASMSRPEQVKIKRIHPEDNVNTGEAFFPVFGAGTVVAKNGTEIANTFAPNTIYTDLEQAFDGFKLPKINTNPEFMMKNKSGDVTDLYSFAAQGGGDALAQITAGIGNPKGYGTSGAGKIGGAIGGTAGKIFFGPVGEMIGKFAGQKIGDALDRKAEKTEEAQENTRKNMEMMAVNQGAQALQRQNYSYMRTGGNIRQNNMAMGGDLQTHWGGYAEPMSYNPYLPDGGETVMFRGQSHDDSDGKGNTGIGITFGDNPVEVERGEPAMKLQNGTDGSSNLTVFGNLKIPSFGAQMIGDSKAEGMKFKNYVADLSKMEQNQNKLMDKSVTELDDLDDNNPYDKLKFNSYKLNMLGANMNLEDIADKKIAAASLQDAINKTAEEMGLSADDLAKGKIKQAKMGAKITTAKDGFTVDEQKKAKELYEQGVKSGDMSAFQKYAEEIAPDLVNQAITKYGVPAAGKFVDKLKGKRTDEVYAGITSPTSMIPVEPGMPSDFSVDVSGLKKPGTERDMIDYFKSQVPALPRPFDAEGKKDKFDWMTLANEVLPYVRPTNAQALDPRQLAGEMYALSTNQVTPVDAQLYQPELSVPYDISLQDMLNKNQSDYRAAQRMMGYNPAAQAMLNAQKYQANQQVLGEQFRMNQAMKEQTYRENRSLLNDAKLRNLQALDQQFVRQQQALSNTKATTQAALNSISAKYAQNQLENRTLQTYENLYNYRFDPRFRAMNMNPLAQFTTEIAGAVPASSEDVKREETETRDAMGRVVKSTSKTKTGRNGALVKAIKSM